MQIRDNVRERRRERIQQLIRQQSNEEKAKIIIVGAEETESLKPESLKPESLKPESLKPEPLKPERERPHVDVPRMDTATLPPLSTRLETDPELWWKEREKKLRTDRAGWQGLKGLSPPSTSNRIDDPTLSFNLTKFLRGFAIRFIFSVFVFAAIWGWFKLEMPGSKDARKWMISSVTRDMDFQSIEVWYGQTFGGSPSFFPFNQGKSDTKEVSALLSPDDTAIPVTGTIIQSFAQNGTGVKVAATGGSDVLAIYTGRVQQVTKAQDGRITVLVQHQNHILSVYGNLEKALVKPNDWVETGQQLGQLTIIDAGEGGGILYFAVQQNGKSLNPAEVVSFD
jgi:stage IV sporulation protein FA